MAGKSVKGPRPVRLALASCLLVALLALPAPSSAGRGANYLKDLFVYQGDALVRVVALFEREVEVPPRPLKRSERAFSLSLPGVAMKPKSRVFLVEEGPLERVEAKEEGGGGVVLIGHLRKSYGGILKEARVEAKKKTLTLTLTLPLPAQAPSGERLRVGKGADGLIDKVLGAGPRAEAAVGGNPLARRAFKAERGYLGPPSPSMFKAGLKLALAFGAIMALLLGGASLFRRLAGEGGLGRRRRLIRLINKSYIGPKKSIALVEVAGEVLVVGISNSNISMLSKVESSDTLRRIRGGSSFDEELGNAMPKVSPEGSGERLRAMAHAFQEKLRELKKI